MKIVEYADECGCKDNEPDETLCDPIFDKLQALLECYCAHLAKTPCGAPARCCIVPGEQAVWDNCCDGTAWLRLVSYYPTRQFPSQDGQRNPCDVGLFAGVVEMGIVRCACAMGEDGSPPSCECLTYSAREAFLDRAAMLQAVKCCFTDTDEAECTDVIVGAWQPLGESGGCVGGSMNITLSFVEYGCPDTGDE